MKIIKKLALCALFANVAYSVELPDLQEDHPIRIAVQMAKFAFVQHPVMLDSINGGATHVFQKLPVLLRDSNIEHIKNTVSIHFEESINNLFLCDDFISILHIPSLIQQDILKEYFVGHPYYINIGPTIDLIIDEANTHIQQSFEKHFGIRMKDKKFSSAYKLALVYRDANTGHAENTAKANRWIAEAEEKATEEVQYVAELCAALYFSPLRFKQHENARRIIESFPPESDSRVRLQSAFDAVLTRPAPAIPTGDRLIIYREIEDMVFRTKDDA